MEQLTQSPADLQQEFYSKKYYLSYSALSKIMYSPSLFYRHYILQQREEKLDSYLIDGKVIHCLLLDDGSFDKQFILMPSTVPTGNTRSIVDKIYNIHFTNDKNSLGEYEDKIIESLKEINLHQSLKTDKQRLDKIITEESKSYFDFLKIKGSKDLIDSETLQRCNEAVDAVKNDPVACELLGLNKHEMDKYDLFNEIPMQSDLQDQPFGIKGIIDNIKVDYANKIVHINDLKTTGKTITDFQETVEYYNYWVQAAIYQLLVKEAFKDLMKSEEGWQIVFHFIVVDKYNQVYSFEVSKVTMMKWGDQLTKKFNEFKWHYTEKRYVLPYEFATSKVIL